MFFSDLIEAESTLQIKSLLFIARHAIGVLSTLTPAGRGDILRFYDTWLAAGPDSLSRL